MSAFGNLSMEVVQNTPPSLSASSWADSWVLLNTPAISNPNCCSRIEKWVATCPAPTIDIFMKRSVSICLCVLFPTEAFPR